MYIDKLIKREVITLLVSVSLLVIIFIGVTYAKFLSVDKGQDTVINMGDLNISFCKDTTCDSTYTNIGQVIGTKVENGTTVPAGIYPFPDNGTYSNETPYIFKVTNTGSLDSTVKIKLKEDASFTPSENYSSYGRLTSKYAGHLKVAIRKRVLYQDTGYQLGDVNMDGIVNIEDTELIRKYFFSPSKVTETFNIKLADINEDGKIYVYLLLFNKIKLFRKNVRNIPMKDVKFETSDFDIKIFKNKDIKINYLELIQNINIDIKNIDLNVNIGTEDAGITAILVGILAGILGIIIKKPKYQILPIYANRNLLKINLNGIFTIYLMHYIYKFIKNNIKERFMDKPLNKNLNFKVR